MKKCTKNAIVFLILIVLIIGITMNTYALNNIKTKYSNLVICIDPGHQSKGNPATEPIAPGSKIKKAKVSSGTTGVFTKVPEYKLTLAIALKLKSLLIKDGFKVVMTREANNVNISNAERAVLANNVKADLSIRIHADGSLNKNMNGISMLYPAKNSNSQSVYERSKLAAETVLKSVINTTSARSKGIVQRSDLTGFNWSKVPSILIETGFMTNINEDKKLENKDYQNKIAEGLAKGIEDYFESNK